MRVLGVGNALMDVFAVVEDEYPASVGVHPGSVLHCPLDAIDALIPSLPDPAIVSGGGAANAMKLGALLGLETSFSGSLGRDERGAMFARELERAGVDGRAFKLSDERTGCALVLRTRSGRYSLMVSPSAALELYGPDVDDEEIARADWIYAEGFLLPRRQLLLSVLNRAMLAKKKIAFDLGSPALVRENRALAMEIATHYADLVFCGEDELEALAGMSITEATALFRLSGAGIVLKRGAEGSAYISEGNYLSCPAPAVEVVDTTAAGDAFSAGYLAALASGSPPAECLARGSAVAGLALRVSGSALGFEDIAKLHA